MKHTIKLADGALIPRFGLGVWQVIDKQQFKVAFDTAVSAGYRHFDTAQIYKNEQFLGSCLKNSKLARQDVFITTKIFPNNFGYNKTLKSFDDSLEKLQTNYVDLLLLHFPAPTGRRASWRALEKLLKDGKAKSIGVSNYSIRHLKLMEKYAEVMPSVNQVEAHVFLQQKELANYCNQHQIALEAYSPLAHAKFMDNKVIKEIAKAHNKSYAQIMLRWCVEQGFITIPKSATPSRIKENIDIFDFKLTDSELKQLASLDQNRRTLRGPNLIP